MPNVPHPFSRVYGVVAQPPRTGQRADLTLPLIARMEVAMTCWQTDDRPLDDEALATLLLTESEVVVTDGDRRFGLKAETMDGPHAPSSERTTVVTLRELDDDRRLYLVDFARVGFDYSSCGSRCRLLDEALELARRVAVGLTGSSLLERAMREL